MNGVKFGDKHSYFDFDLILTNKEIQYPDPKTEKVDVMGMDGELDLTNVLGDTVKFHNRKLSFTFTLIKNSQKEFANSLTEIANYLHGNKFRIVIDSDSEYYYVGRCTINKFKTDKRTSTIQIDVDAEPYKYEVIPENKRWLWNPFSFENGVIPNTEISITGSKELHLKNLKKVVIPKITCSVPMTLTIDGKTYNLKSGENLIHEIKLHEGDNLVTVTVESGTGTIKFEYVCGAL